MLQDFAFILLCIAVLSLSLVQMAMSRRLSLLENFIDSVIQIFKESIDKSTTESE